MSSVMDRARRCPGAGEATPCKGLDAPHFPSLHNHFLRAPGGTEHPGDLAEVLDCDPGTSFTFWLSPDVLCSLSSVACMEIVGREDSDCWEAQGAPGGLPLSSAQPRGPQSLGSGQVWISARVHRGLSVPPSDCTAQGTRRVHTLIGQCWALGNLWPLGRGLKNLDRQPGWGPCGDPPQEGGEERGSLSTVPPSPGLMPGAGIQCGAGSGLKYPLGRAG